MSNKGPELKAKWAIVGFGLLCAVGGAYGGSYVGFGLSLILLGFAVLVYLVLTGRT